VPYNPKERIWQEADQLRAAHPAGRSLPVKVLDLAKFDPGLDLVPADGLREQLDIEALLLINRSWILHSQFARHNPTKLCNMPLPLFHPFTAAVV
jgi:hypothetical protein